MLWLMSMLRRVDCLLLIQCAMAKQILPPTTLHWTLKKAQVAEDKLNLNISFPLEEAPNLQILRQIRLLGMSCPSWQWHRTGSCWSPVRTLPVAPLWGDLGFVPNSRGNKAAANLLPSASGPFWPSEHSLYKLQVATYLILKHSDH